MYKKEGLLPEYTKYIYICMLVGCIIVSETKVEIRKQRSFFNDAFCWNGLDSASSGWNERQRCV